MQLHTETEYNAALAEFLALASESQQAHRERLLVLRDAIDAYEVAAGHEPAPPNSPTL